MCLNITAGYDQSLKVRSHQQTETGFGLRLDLDWDWVWTETGFGLRLAWDRTLGCVHTRLAWTFQTKQTNFSTRQTFRGQLYFNFCFTGAHCCPPVISSPKSVRLRSHYFAWVRSEFFPSPPRLGGLKSCPNWVQIQSACVHTRGLAIQIQSKSAGVNAP